MCDILKTPENQPSHEAFNKVHNNCLINNTFNFDLCSTTLWKKKVINLSSTHLDYYVKNRRALKSLLS